MKAHNQFDLRFYIVFRAILKDEFLGEMPSLLRQGDSM
jgi:hypothetical protein